MKDVIIAIGCLAVGIVLDFSACLLGGNGMVFSTLMIISMFFGLGFVIAVNRVNDQAGGAGKRENVSASEANEGIAA